MNCDHCGDAEPRRATRAFDVPGSMLLRLCDEHADAPDRPRGTVEVVEVELMSADVGVVPERVDLAGRGGATVIVPHATYVRWRAAQTAWEEVQDEMTTELAKATVGALALNRDLAGG